MPGTGEDQLGRAAPGVEVRRPRRGRPELVPRFLDVPALGLPVELHLGAADRVGEIAHGDAALREDLVDLGVVARPVGGEAMRAVAQLDGAPRLDHLLGDAFDRLRAIEERRALLGIGRMQQRVERRIRSGRRARGLRECRRCPEGGDA
jgi:hypothetical protein